MSLLNKIMHRIIWQPAFTLPFSREDKARTLGETSAVKVIPDQAIKSSVLFQHFLVISKIGGLSLGEVMSYELSLLPTALFEARNVFWKSDKPQLAHMICELARDAILDSVPETECHVHDGGSLLHHIPWKWGESYGGIAQSYATLPSGIMVQLQLLFLMAMRKGSPWKTTCIREKITIFIPLSASLLTQSFQEKREVPAKKC